MKILHVFSNWKWTGPAEHALNLAAALQKDGHRITFACGVPPTGITDSIVGAAQAAGISPETHFNLNKHFKLFKNIADIAGLRRFIQQEKFDLIHTHLTNDHFLAGSAARLCSAKIPVVRTCYEGDGIKGGSKTRFLLSKLTDGLITISERTRNHIIHAYPLQPHRIWTVHIPVDHGRFDRRSIKNKRAQYGLSESEIVGGIVARVQKHRRFEILLEALRLVVQELPQLKFMIIGRGTHIEETAIKPSQRMGLRPNMIFTGYCKKDFPETLACLDFKVFLVPGTDGSCRAVREAMAMGIPVIAADRGMLPEIITKGVDGFIIDDTPENLARAMLNLIEDPELRHRMGQNALQKTLVSFDLEKQSRRVAEIYEKLLGR